MGLFEKLLGKFSTKTALGTADIVLRSYNTYKQQYPSMSRSDLFKLVLNNRYSVIKTMNDVHIDAMARNVTNVVDLTLSILAYENPIAIRNDDGSIWDAISAFFSNNAPDELTTFENNSDMAYAFIVLYEKSMGRM
jgi:hypothetical protein